MQNEIEKKEAPSTEAGGVPSKPYVSVSVLNRRPHVTEKNEWTASSEKSVKVQVVQAPPNADSSEEEHEDDNEEEPDIDDSEILAELPDDTEVCVVAGHLPIRPRVFLRLLLSVLRVRAVKKLTAGRK
jgi:hypothetical protein